MLENLGTQDLEVKVATTLKWSQDPNKCLNEDMIKVILCQIPHHLAARDPEYVTRFLEEVKANSGPTSRVLQSLCFIKDLLKFPQHLPLLTVDNWLWNLLSEGLTQTQDSMCRKRSSYLLKRAVFCPEMVESSCVLKTSCGPTSQLWTDFFIVIESLDEKQVHIVKQIIGRLNGLHSQTQMDEEQPLTEETPLHLSWLLCVYRLFFFHQNDAIARWSIEHFLQTFAGSKATIHPSMVDFYAKSLLPALNSNGLYSYHFEPNREDPYHFGEREPLVKCQFEELLTNFFDKMLGQHPFVVVLEALVEIPWGPLPLFHVIRSLQNASGQVSLSSSTLDILERFLAQGMQCQEPELKRAIRRSMVKLVFQTLHISELGTKRPFEFLCNVYSTTKEFKFDYRQQWDPIRIPEAWNEVLETLDKQDIVLRQLEDMKPEDSLVSRTKQAKQIAVSSVMFNVDKSVSEILTSRLVDKIERPYSDSLSEVLVLYEVNLIDDLSIPRLRLDHNGVQKLLSQSREAVLDDPEETFEVCRKTAVVGDVLSQSMSNELLEQLLEVLATTKDPFYQVALMHLVSKHGFNPPSQISSTLCQLFEGYDDKIKSSWGSSSMLLSKYQKVLWQFNSHCLSEIKDAPDEFIELVYNEACVALSTVTGEALEHVIDTLAEIVTKKPEMIEKISGDVLDAAYSAVFELRKNEKFKPSLDSLVALCGKMTCDARAGAVLMRLAQEADHVFSIALSIFENLAGFNKPSSDSSYLAFLVEMITYGPICRKDQVQLWICTKLMLKRGLGCAEIRAEFTNNLLQMIEGNGDGVMLLQAIDLFIAKDVAVTGTKKRHFEHSLIHLTRFRIYQAFLALTTEEVLTEAGAEKLLDISLNSILHESQQLSVRYLSEWVVIRALSQFPSLSFKLDQAYEEAIKQRLGCLQSFLAIKYHVANSKGDSASIEQALLDLSPWTMAQHFAVRTYAQVFSQRLLKTAKEKELTDITEKFDVFETAVERSVKYQGTNLKNMEKLKSDFYLMDFDPEVNFNMEDIFQHFPRVCNFPVTEFAGFDFNPISDGPLAFKDDESRLQSHVEDQKCWCKGCHLPKVMNDEKLDLLDDVSGSNIQKKVMPWTAMLNEDETKQEIAPLHQDLVVVASLIDKLPNLGGLCRTCEVFGVGKYVIPCLKNCEETEFRNVSVTAQQWTPMIEVRPCALLAYLREQKAHGFTVIGIEQTSQSVSLEKFQFPTKTVLVFGNEKEGIPVEIIDELDRCVEIPQHGLIRSLNVHVSASIVIWEYVRQQSLKNYS